MKREKFFTTAFFARDNISENSVNEVSKMAREITNNKYISVKIPEGLAIKIDTLIAGSKHDFTSRTDVIKYGVRLLYDSRYQIKEKAI